MTDESTDSSPSRFSSVAKWTGIVVGTLVALMVAVAVVVPKLFTSEELKGYVIPPIEEATGRTVQIDGIALQILPAPAVRMTDFQMSNAEGFGEEPAVSGRAFRVDVALWPLFTGSIEPTAVELVDPVIRYQVAEDGSTNFDDMGGTAEPTTQAAEKTSVPSIPVSNFRMSGARILYTDASTGQSMDLAFEARLSALPQDGNVLTSDGTIDIASLRAVLPAAGEDTLAVTDAQLRYDVRAALDDDRLDVRSLTLDTAPLGLDLSGSIADLSTRPRLDLQLETGETDLSELAAFVPAAAVDGLNPSGQLQLTTTIRGLLPDSTGSLDSLTVEGTGTLAGLGVDYEGAALLRDLNADLALSLDSAAIRSMRGQLLGRPLEGNVAVADLMGDPTVGGRLSGAADLAELSPLATGASEEPVEVAGSADYDVRFAGPVAAPGDIRPTGTVRLADVRYPTPSLRAPLEIPELTVDLTGDGVAMDRFTMTSGEEQMALRATVRDLFPLSEGLAETNPALAADFTVTADRLDLIQLFPEADTADVTYAQLFSAKLAGSRVNGQDPEVLAKRQYGDVELPEYAVDGRVEIGTLLNDPQRFDDLAFDVQMDDRRLEVRNLSGRTYGGQLAGSLTFDQSEAGASARATGAQGSVLMAAAGGGAAPSPAAAAPGSGLTYDFQLKDAKASAFLEEWTTLGRVVNGTLDLNVTGSSPLSDGLLPLADALTAEGRSLVADGGLSLNLGPARAFVETLGLGESTLTEFQQFGGPFEIRNGALQIGEWTLGGQELSGTLSGSLGLAGSVDLTLRSDMPMSRIQNSKIGGLVGGDDGLSSLLQKLAGGESGDQTVPVRIQIGGTMSDPQVQVLNRDAVRSGIRQVARDAGLLDRLRNLFDGGGR